MQRSLCRLTKGHRPNVAAAAAVTATTAAVAVLKRQSDDDDDKECLQDGSNRLAPPLLSWNNNPYVVKCDAAMLNDPPRFVENVRFRRHWTVKQLEESAEQDRLEDHYAVHWKRPLGQGSFGAVFPAINRATGERVAVKQIFKRYTDDGAFQREMDSLILLREHGGHPNICGMREHFDEGHNFYIVMDLVGGREMFEELCCGGAYSEADAARHIQEVASALAFLHGTGMVHCDVKPENLMLSSKDRSADAVVKLVDLGSAHMLAKAPHLDHQPRTTAATPAYCPPELLLESRENPNGHVTIAPSFDMWALGIVIYIMLVGVHPFDLDASATDKEIQERILSGDKPPLRGFKKAEHLSEDAISLLEGLMEADPEKRLTAEQVLENRWVQGETASSKKIADSDKRLAAYRKFKTQIGATFFKTLLSQTDAVNRGRMTERTSVLESAFRRLDTERRGYLSTSAICDDEVGWFEAETKLSFSDISSLLSQNMKNRYYGKDHVLYNEGDSGDSMYVINSGMVEVTTKDGFKKLRKSGEVFGEEVMKDKNKTHSSTVRCKTPVHLLEISRDLYEKYVSSDRETLLSMAETDRHRRREHATNILRSNKECRDLSYGKGETIFRAGEKGDQLYLLSDGEVDISVRGHKVRSLQKDEVTGEHAAYFGKPYNVTAMCVSKTCRVQALPSGVMHKLFDLDSSLQQNFRDLLLRRDFKKAVCVKIGRTFPTTEGEIRAAFDAIDTERSGAIAFDRLREIVWHFDPTYNEQDIRGMLESLDLNESGSLTWEVFHRIFAMDKEA